MTPFGSLSRNAVAAVQIGSSESRSLNHYYLGVEHLVIGLCKISDRDLESAMQDAGFDPKIFRRHMRNSLGKTKPPPWGTRLLTTPRLTHVLRLAEKIAGHCRKGEVDPCHLMLAVLLENGSVPVRTFAALGWDVGPLKGRLWERVEGRPSSQADAGNPQSGTPCLDSMGRDLTALALEGKLKPVIGRKSTILSAARVLARQAKNNLLLIGDPGVGKSCIVEGLAQRAVREDAPASLGGKRIVEISMGSLLARTKYRGDLEDKLEGVIKEASGNPDVILFFDEIHTLIGAGAGSGALDAANLLKPALGRGEIRCIGATTIQEYRRCFEKDTAFERRFEIVRVEEPTSAETLEVLAGIRPSLEAHHGLAISDDVLREAVRLGERYIAERRFPDKAIDILDRACSEARLQTLTGAKAELQAVPVTKEAVARVVSQWTGIPIGSLTRQESEALLGLEETLRGRVVGQDEAVHLVAQAVIAGRQLEDRRRPQGVFLFLGSTGVGKTELAKALASSLFGSESHLVRLDMSEYMERHAVMRLIGAPPSYIGYEDEGQLTGAVRRKPYSIILLDEIEKAHPDVLNVFLQMLDDGRLTDSKGRTVDFTHTVIVMTSNLGIARGGKGERTIGFGAHGQDGERPDRSSYASALRMAAVRSLRPEFVNRIDEIVVFNPLSREDLRTIVGILLEDVKGQVAERGLRLDIDEDVVDLLIEHGYSDAYGARELRRALDSAVRKPLARFLLEEGVLTAKTVRAARSGGEVKFLRAEQARPGGAR